MQVMKNIYQVLGGAYSNIANIFVVKGNTSLIMIDTAETEDEYTVIQENLKYWGLDNYPVSHVLLSHKHLNHIGNAFRYREMGAKVVAGVADAEAIEKGITTQICDYGPFPKKAPYVPCPVDIKVKDGDVLNIDDIRIEVFEVPGHTSGSVFYKLTMEDKIVIFTGDVLNVGTDCRYSLLGWEGGVDFDRNVFFESIKRFSQMPCDIILPGHYQLCMQDGWKIMQGAYAAALMQWRQPSVTFE